MSVESVMATMPDGGRAIVERQRLADGRLALRVWTVDGTDILDEGGRTVLCWNALSREQQRVLIEGNYGEPIRAYPGRFDGGCVMEATVLVECVGDEGPGPRFYCLRCAIEHLTEKRELRDALRVHGEGFGNGGPT